MNASQFGRRVSPLLACIGLLCVWQVGALVLKTDSFPTALEAIRAMGVRAAHRYFLTAERFGAQEALRIGLVHEVVAADQLDRKVGELAQALVQAGPQAVKACKKLLHDVGGHEITAGLVQRTVEGIADIRASDEAREGVQSFIERREARFKGR